MTLSEARKRIAKLEDREATEFQAPGPVPLYVILGLYWGYIEAILGLY